MITDVPTRDEFFDRADSLLQLSFSIVWGLYDGQSRHWDVGADDEDLEEYWKRCRVPLANGLALIQQAHELYLKGLIAGVSPFLLIARDPSAWPSGAKTADISFSQFLTVGAAELPKLHDIVCTPRLNDQIVQMLNEVREKRNGFIHQGSSPYATVEELFEAIFETHLWTHENETWFAARAAYLENDHISALYNSDHVMAGLHREFEALLDLLPPAKFKRYFNLNKKGRWSYCPNCRRDTGDHGDPEQTAQVTKSVTGADVLRCLVCGTDTDLVDSSCNDPSCGCSLLTVDTDKWESVCLKCDAYGDPELYAQEVKRRERWETEGVLAGLTGPPFDTP
jgi:hypothetical protein